MTYLLHARPRLLYHLGHLKMLNTLYRILVDGNNVVLLLIPYDEHDSRNRTLRARQQEEIELTRGFYRNYLGFDAPKLKVVSTLELDLAKRRMEEIQAVYFRLYTEGVPSVKRLIDEQNRSWASPNILFVPKCIAAIELLAPDQLICGEKHRVIAECFDEVLKELGHRIPFSTFEDFPDLFMGLGMDTLDSKERIIDINDNADFLLHKLAQLREMPDQKSAWMRKFIEHILEPAPERVKSDISRVHRSAAEQEMALTKLLANVRALIPYSLDQGEEGVQVRWGSIIGAGYSELTRLRIERMARQLFRDGNCRAVSLHRFIPAGKSGSTVLEVREHEHLNDLRISNVSILKVGSEHELRQEYENYKKLVKDRGTAAFMTIKKFRVTADGMAGIIYQDAHHHLGLRRQERIENIADLFRPVQYDPERAREILGRLMVTHLHEVLYKHGTTVDADSIRSFINEFLPAEYVVEVSGYDPRGSTAISTKSDGRFASREVEISEVDLRRRVLRAYTVAEHAKIDIFLGDRNEILLNEAAPGRRLWIEGKILTSRRDSYNSLLGRLGVVRRERTLEIEGIQLSDPTMQMEEELDREHYLFTLSPIHGDLHAENVLFGADGFGIIDFGKMRERFPALYDIAYLYADLKTRFVVNRYDIATLERVERALVAGTRPWRRRDRVAVRDLSFFEHSFLPQEIKQHGREETFYWLLGMILLGRLKFDVPGAEKRVGLVLAHYAFKRMGRGE
ncbi:hypothetical protein Arub01_11630 [Actinomadura rubrobrunea]|uniref:Protein kinase domain-containing protein n=1 Tax=Actinomadura rubrobrunea TaxID=115335 RepID=A0A9W6PTQ9_9ACTN|nr:phosphotransferase [Actinomadura rubrobrunea]GLW62919.1 hypothetical protein Arub01_11630 [Actinomadura rubrobrunea]